MLCEMKYLGNGICKCIRCPNVAKTVHPDKVVANCRNGQVDGINRPSIFKRGWSYATALARWTAAGQPRRSDEDRSNILSICQSCSEYRPNPNDSTKGHCRLCGCGLSDKNEVTNKIMMATEVCPKGKW